MTNRTASPRVSVTLSLDGENLYGRLSYPEVKVPMRRVRKASSLNINLMHRAKNGVYDPLTYYHVLDVMARIEPGQEFRTSDLLIALRAHKTQLHWDPTTVGRVVTDIAESLFEAYGWTPVAYTKRWNGMTYDILDRPEARVAMIRLLDDLGDLSQKMIEQEQQGIYEKRINSPLIHCPSVSV